MRKPSLFILAVVVAAGAFWVTMLTTPPKTQASVQPINNGIDVYDMMTGVTLPEAELAPTH
jgi:hypothetical protein